ncbi:hypothetical protein BV20DRAFT_287132 [Pilatotrama ljubarskyi]|nr:hypothetical protein BV20DRAFT_287132 [Pilatotrama ljubarskyi]
MDIPVSQGFVVAKFNPSSSAYWLSPSARVAASRIVTQPFWAFAYWYPGEEGAEPPYLSAISSKPSPSNLPNASFLLGPKQAIDSGMLWFDPAALIVHPPLPSTHAELCQPVYLHSEPSLITLDHITATKTPPFMLEATAFDIFRTLGRQTRSEAYTRALARQNARIGAWTFGEDPPEDDRLGYVFGQLSNPRAYAFDYGIRASDCLPPFEHVATLYEEIYLYIQLCKDYRWPGVEDTIAWAQAMRTKRTPGRMRRPEGVCRLMTKPSTLLQRDDRFREDAQTAWDLALMPRYYTESGGLPEEEDESELHSDSPYLLEFAFPDAPEWYPTIELGRPRVIVFDVFGVLLDRENAILTALRAWLPADWQDRRPENDIEDVVKLYIECEALANRARSESARSVPELIQTALADVAMFLDLPFSDTQTQAFPGPRRSPALHSPAADAYCARARAAADAAAIATILRPRPFPDVELAVQRLAHTGGDCTLLCIPPYSAAHMDLLRPSLPPALRGPPTCSLAAAAPLHTPCPPGVFDALAALVPPDVRPEEILLVSAGVGRVISPALVRRHATALVRRPGSLEGNVRFIISRKRERNPVPSVRVSDLGKLCDALGLA